VSRGWWGDNTASRLPIGTRRVGMWWGGVRDEVGGGWRVPHWHRVTTTTSTYELRPTKVPTVLLLLYDYRGGAASRSRSRISIRCVFASGDAPRSHRIVSIVYSLLNYYLYRFRRPLETAEATFVYFCT